MKRFFLSLLLLSCIVLCNAQNLITERSKNIINEYISGIHNGVDVTPLVVKIKDMYGNVNAMQKEEIKEMIVEVISEQLSDNQIIIARSLINIYQMLAEQNDRKLPLLYFLLGNMYAEQMDSINLKNAISSLKNCIDNDDNSLGYLNSLNGYLEQIRRYTPVTKGIEDSWISDVVVENKHLSLPKYRIEAFHVGDNINYIISGAFIASYNTKVFQKRAILLVKMRRLHKL